MAFIATWAQNKAAEYLKTGIQAGGTLAGNAVGGVGSLIEDSGRAFGEGTVNGSIRGVGNYINGYGENIKGSMAADGPVRTGPKKTPVKPAQPKAVSAAKMLPSSAQKTSSSVSNKVIPQSKPVARVQKATPPRPTTVATPVLQRQGNQKAKVAPTNASKPFTTAGSSARLAKPPGKPLSRASPGQPAPGGKIRISAASRPKPPIKV